MPVLSTLTPRNSCLAAAKVYLAKLNEPSAASNRRSTFNVDVRCPFQAWVRPYPALLTSYGCLPVSLEAVSCLPFSTICVSLCVI